MLFMQLLKVRERVGCNFPSAQRVLMESASISASAAVFCSPAKQPDSIISIVLLSPTKFNF